MSPCPCEDLGNPWKNASQLSVPKTSRETTNVAIAVTLALTNTRR
jgi:hypothetical protein